MQRLMADVVWPAVLLEEEFLGFIPITVGLVVEWLVLWRGGFGLTWKKSAVVDLTMNAVSTAVGVILIPFLGFAWSFLAFRPIAIMLELHFFSLADWTINFVLIVLTTTAIEAAVVRWGFKIALGAKRFWILCAANCASVAVALLSVLQHAPLHLR